MIYHLEEKKTRKKLQIINHVKNTRLEIIHQYEQKKNLCYPVECIIIEMLIIITDS